MNVEYPFAIQQRNDRMFGIFSKKGTSSDGALNGYQFSGATGH